MNNVGNLKVNIELDTIWKNYEFYILQYKRINNIKQEL